MRIYCEECGDEIQSKNQRCWETGGTCYVEETAQIAHQLSQRGTSAAAKYKGRKYTVLYVGNTKFGRRAKLQFLNGKKEFWVDASKVVLV